MPQVSVIVPNYNYARFLHQRLGSIEQQTFTDYEFILLDDASTDDSVPLLESFARKHQCRLICNSQNSGNVFKQWNKGLSLATGKYVWIAEADDYADSRFLETLVGRLEQNPQCGIAYCNSLRVDSNNSIVELVQPTMSGIDLTRWQHDFVSNGREECFRYLLRENTIPNASAVVFKRELYEAIGQVDEGLKGCSDWKFWASLLQRSDLAFVAEPLNYFRYHKNTTRARASFWSASLPESLEVMKYIAGSMDVPRDALEDLHARIAMVLLGMLVLITERPTISDVVRIRKLTSELHFGFSVRAVQGVAKGLLEGIGKRLRGSPRQ
jgi:glycosyltransferase involved in cell wall biosynthesis